MKWSTELPTVPGWYWWRRGYWLYGGREVPKPVEITSPGWAYIGDWADERSTAAMGGEWAGPIPLPQEPPPTGAQIYAQAVAEGRMLQARGIRSYLLTHGYATAEQIAAAQASVEQMGYDAGEPSPTPTDPSPAAKEAP